LAWICISRDGPANPREKLDKPESAAHGLLLEEFNFLFQVSSPYQLGENKAAIFQLKSQFWKKVLRNLSPWALPLTDLVEDLYYLLRNAYKARNFENLHDEVLKAFDNAEKKLRKPPESVGPADPWEGYDLSEAKYKEPRRKEEARRSEGGNAGEWDPPAEDTASGSTSAVGGAGPSAAPESPTAAKSTGGRSRR